MSARSDPAPQPAHAVVKRELLVRYLDAWAPVALHHARRATYAQAGPDAQAGPVAPGEGPAAAALRVFGEFPELLARHRLAVVVTGVAEDAAPAVAAGLAEVLTEVGSPPGLSHQVTSGPLAATLRAAGALDGPLFAYVDAAGGSPPAFDELAALAAGRRTELLLAVDPTAVAALATGSPGGRAPRPGPHAEPPAPAVPAVGLVRAALGRAGLPHVACVELVDAAGSGQLLLFATGSVKHLATFKEAMWAVDEYAGVRYRDPTDPDRALLDISLRPPLGPLKRQLLLHLEAGPCTVDQLRDFALGQTVYRAADVPAAVTSLLGAGALTRDPARGRLTAQTVIGSRRTA
ncbi:MAG TPA: hypothetical protein VFM54_23660 [Micromonosporaceae bacterium]|nr:hypothetical protein [Micromonosporaceae bacterium]